MHTRRYSFQFALYSLTIHKEFVAFVYYDLANNIFFLRMLTILYTCLLFIIWLLLHLNADSYALIIDDKSQSAIRHPQDAVFLLPFNNFFSSKYRLLNCFSPLNSSPKMRSIIDAFYPFSFPFFVWN